MVLGVVKRVPADEAELDQMHVNRMCISSEIDDVPELSAPLFRSLGNGVSEESYDLQEAREQRGVRMCQSDADQNTVPK